MQKKSLGQIMLELRSLSGFAESIEGGVDWMVPSDCLSDDDELLLRTMAMMGEEDESEKAAAKHTVKGKTESLAERLSGLDDFIDNEDYKAATVAMEKIYEDLGVLLKEMKKRTADKEISDKKKEAEAKEAEAQQQMGQGQDGGQEPTGQTNRPPETSTDSGAAGQAVAAGNARGEGVVIIGGEVIEEAFRGDPFGFGVEFMDELRKRSGIRSRKK